MKKRIKNICLVLLLSMGINSFAQSTIAHIDSQQLLNLMPEMLEAQDQLKKLQENYRTSFEGVYKEFEAKLQEFQNLPPTTTQEEGEKKQKEIIELQQRIKEAEKNAAQEIQKKQTELTTPIFEKAKDAIKKVAEKQDFSFVLDTASQLLVVAKGKNLLQDVKAELGISEQDK